MILLCATSDTLVQAMADRKLSCKPLELPDDPRSRKSSKSMEFEDVSRRPSIVELAKRDPRIKIGMVCDLLAA